ncbi:MAG: hypothetical protein JW754_02750 [Candidatus Aenigmarchaeota archaeon]|nr:hypothetical protein [Candidatus Aenigmarchaeota archaeon]
MPRIFIAHKDGEVGWYATNFRPPRDDVVFRTYDVPEKKYGKTLAIAGRFASTLNNDKELNVNETISPSLSELAFTTRFREKYLDLMNSMKEPLPDHNYVSLWTDAIRIRHALWPFNNYAVEVAGRGDFPVECCQSSDGDSIPGEEFFNGRVVVKRKFF